MQSIVSQHAAADSECMRSAVVVCCWFSVSTELLYVIFLEIFVALTVTFTVG
jgi:hypothetical protein